MPHEYAGKYSTKHPENTKKDIEIIKELEKIGKTAVSCKAAHAIAEKLNKHPEEIGIMIDLTEKKIEKCQMNLFGHGKDKPVNKPDYDAKDEIKNDIEEKTDQNSKISCKNCWIIAEKHKIPKMKITEICEGLKIKIKECQIGAF